jgi:hypothetical protein
MLPQMRKTYAAAAVVAGSMLAGGAIGVAVFAPHLANAASNPSSPAVTVSGSGSQAPAGPGSGFHSNEDPAHEAQESPEREAEEDSGTAFHGGRGGHHGFNEDPAHEANESPEREAQEDQEGGGSGQTAPPAAAPSPAS